MAPGWYPDPWRAGGLRWWNGSGWTEHTSSAFPPAPDPRRDLDEAQRAAVWAKRGFIAVFAGMLVSMITSIIVFSSVADDFAHVLDGSRKKTGYENLNLLSTPASLLSIGGLIAVAIWSWKAARIGRNLRYPAQLSSGWVVAGWFVPIVNFWFPYQAVRDCLSPFNPKRRLVAYWWTTYILGFVLWIPPMIAAIIASYGLAVALALPAALNACFQLHYALQVVDAVVEDHTAAIARVTT